MGRQQPRDQKEWKGDSEGQERSKNLKKKGRTEQSRGESSREEQREKMSKEG